VLRNSLLNSLEIDVCFHENNIKTLNLSFMNSHDMESFNKILESQS